MGWAGGRAVTVLEQQVKDVMAWVDDQDSSGLPGLQDDTVPPAPKVHILNLLSYKVEIKGI